MESKNEITHAIELIPLNNTPVKMENSIAAFNQPLANLLTHIGLPTENILAPIEERRKVIFSLESTLEILPYDEREKAVYLSKFTVAIAVGLFDGALTFLWDETVMALRRLVASFDLQYFYQVAETIGPRYKSLQTEEDLAAISEHDLLEISRRIGLVNDINFKRLEHVNYLRNHASSAHPNDNEVSGIEMLSLLEHCLKYAITAKPDHSVIKIKQLLDNIRKNSIPVEDFSIIGHDLAKQNQERINDFILSIFGLYCDPKQDSIVKTNIENLMPYAWESSTEEIKYLIGSKFGLYRKNGDVDRRNATHKILELVNGLRYKDEDSLAAELIEKLQNLRTVHFEWNNFYNEFSHAKSIGESIPTSGIPEAARKIFVKVISICLIGNGKGYRDGVDENAEPFYKKFVRNYFNTNEIIDFLELFSDQEFVSDLDKTRPDLRVRKLSSSLKQKTTDVHINNALDVVISYQPGKLSKVHLDSKFRAAMKYVKRV